MSYLGPLILLLGFLVNDAVGWRATGVSLEPGHAVKLAREIGLEVSLDGITGADRDAVSDLTIKRNAAAPRQLRAGYLRPARWGNLWLAQQATGPALTASAIGANRPLVLQSLATGDDIGEELRIPFRQTQTEQAFTIPTHNLAFQVVSYASLPDLGFNAPVFLVEVFRGAEATPAVSQIFENETSITIDDVVCRLRRDRHAVVDVAYLPGLALLLLGAALTFVGVLLTLGWGVGRLWATLVTEDAGIAVTLQAAGAADDEAELTRLADRLQAQAQTAVQETSDAA